MVSTKGQTGNKSWDCMLDVSFLPAYCMKTFEEMFITGFFEIGVSIFGPNVANPTLRYVAYKDANYRDPVHEDI